MCCIAFFPIAMLTSVVSGELPPPLKIEPVFDGEKSIFVIEQALAQADSIDFAAYEASEASLFPIGVNPDVLAYCIIASAVHEDNPDRITRLTTALSRIADLDPPGLVRLGIDWPDYLAAAPVLATMKFEGPFEVGVPDGGIRYVGTTALYESPLFSGQFPGNRQLTFGQLVREALQRIKSRTDAKE